mmetsp:Transcript_14010/g.34676  ORF Transcript_14010/g.34676 Transcript_14010/m.34676 type:complete len:161 (-) Transcript_14010:312-794(-)
MTLGAARAGVLSQLGVGTSAVDFDTVARPAGVATRSRRSTDCSTSSGPHQSQKPSSFVEFHFHNPFTKTVDDKKWTDQQDGSALDAVKGGHWKYMRIFTPPSTQRPISMYAKDLEHFLGRCQYWFGRGQKTDAGNAADLEACQQYHLRLGEPHDGIFAFF